MYDLTIAIPTYNRAVALEKLLEALACQSGIDGVQIVVSDNGSTDNTAGILRAYDPRLNLSVVGFAENRGFDRNYVNCWSAAQGKFVWVMGDDDALVQGAVQTVLGRLRGQDPPDILICNGGDYRNCVLTARIRYQVEPLNNADTLMREVGWHICWIGTTVVRRTLVDLKRLKPLDFNAFVHLPLLLRSIDGTERILFDSEIKLHTTVNNSDYFKSPLSLAQTFGAQLHDTLAVLQADGVLSLPGVSRTLKGFHTHLGMFGVRDMLAWRRMGQLDWWGFARHERLFRRLNSLALLASAILCIPHWILNGAYFVKRSLSAAGRRR